MIFFIIDFDTPAYTEKHMQQKLESYFGYDITITCIRGKHNVVIFRSVAEKTFEYFKTSAAITNYW